MRINLCVNRLLSRKINAFYDTCLPKLFNEWGPKNNATLLLKRGWVNVKKKQPSNT